MKSVRPFSFVGVLDRPPDQVGGRLYLRSVYPKGHVSRCILVVMPLQNGIQKDLPAPGGRELKGGGYDKIVSPSFFISSPQGRKNTSGTGEMICRSKLSSPQKYVLR